MSFIDNIGNIAMFVISLNFKKNRVGRGNFKKNNVGKKSDRHYDCYNTMDI